MKNTQKGFIVPLLIIIAVLAIGGGVYVYQNKYMTTVSPIDRPDQTTNDSQNNTQATAVTQVTTPKNTSANKPVAPVNTTPSNAKPSITVLSPNGSELLEQNTSYSITWKYTGLSDNDSITIGFRTPNENVCWVGKTTASKRSYSFVPSQVKCSGSIVDLKSGGQFKAQLIVEKYADGQGVADTSDNYFNVVANSSASPIITVLSPNGGEFYKVGSQQIIKWSAPTSIQTVRIFLESISTHYAGGGVGGYIPDVHNILAQDATNSGSYAVNIPSVPAGTYKILIEGIDNSGKPTVLSDSSNSYFTITN